MEKEKAETLRIFQASRADGTKLWLSVRRPTQEEIEYAGYEFAARFNRCLMARIPGRNRVRHQLQKNGMWGKEQEDRIQQLQDEGIPLETRLEKDDFKNDEEKAIAQKRHAEILDELIPLRSDLESMLSHTADSIAEDARRDYLIACTIEYATKDAKGDKVNGDFGGQRYWSSLAAMLDDTDQVLQNRVYYEYTTFNNGVKSEWSKILGEDDAKTEPETKADNDVAPEAVEIVNDASNKHAKPEPEPEISTGSPVEAQAESE